MSALSSECKQVKRATKPWKNTESSSWKAQLCSQTFINLLALSIHHWDGGPDRQVRKTNSAQSTVRLFFFSADAGPCEIFTVVQNLSLQWTLHTHLHTCLYWKPPGVDQHLINFRALNLWLCAINVLLFASTDELSVDQPYAVLKAPKVWGALHGKTFCSCNP